MNTIRNVIIVVLVLITSCHVSLNPKIGPVTTHAIIINTARINTLGCPVAWEAQVAKRANRDVGYLCVIVSPYIEFDFYQPNAALKLRAERARFLTASNRKSVNAKEPSASSACYVAQSNSFNSSTVNLACLRICERVERLIGRWAGTMSLNVSVGVVFCSFIWLPRCRTTTHPARRRARTTAWEFRLGALVL